MNTYQSPSLKDISIGKETSQQMLKLLRSKSILQEYVEKLEINKRISWKKYNTEHCLFPTLTEQDVRNITFGK